MLGSWGRAYKEASGLLAKLADSFVHDRSRRSGVPALHHLSPDNTRVLLAC